MYIDDRILQYNERLVLSGPWTNVQMEGLRVRFDAPNSCGMTVMVISEGGPDLLIVTCDGAEMRWPLSRADARTVIAHFQNMQGGVSGGKRKLRSKKRRSSKKYTH